MIAERNYRGNLLRCCPQYQAVQACYAGKQKYVRARKLVTFISAPCKNFHKSYELLNALEILFISL
jgi:hypothetical protein